MPPSLYGTREWVGTVVGQAGGDVRVVVLHAVQVHAVEVERVLGGQVLRVQVVGHDLRVDVEQPAEVLDALGKGAQGLGVLQVTDVVREECMAAFSSSAARCRGSPPSTGWRCGSRSRVAA
jgi:hypothetical protein